MNETHFSNGEQIFAGIIMSIILIVVIMRYIESRKFKKKYFGKDFEDKFKVFDEDPFFKN